MFLIVYLRQGGIKIYQVFQVLLFVMVFGSILFVAYIATKFIGGKTSRSMKGKYIKTVETINIGIDKTIHLIKVGDQFVLISSTGKNIQFLTNAKIEGYTEFEEADNVSNKIHEFKNFFDKYSNMYKRRKDNASNRSSIESDEGLNNQKNIGYNLAKLKEVVSGISKNSKENGDVYTNEK